MVSQENGSSHQPETDDGIDAAVGSEGLTDEIAAALAELKAAQEKLDALKAKAAGATSSETASDEPGTGSVATGTGDGFPLEVEPILITPVMAESAISASHAASNAETTGSAPAVEGHSTFTQGVPVPPEGATAPADPSSASAPPFPTEGTPPPPSPYAQQPPRHASAQQGTGQTPPPPYYQPTMVSKDHVAAGLLGIFLGSMGIHKFYLGYNTAGFMMLAISILGSIFTFGAAAATVGLVGIIEGIVYLLKPQSEFEQTYVYNKREWF
ncbi:MAG: TM2 domain-containing protein [Coriobacteriaceae bacterium]|jgi:TM2 domain-containing membrane protein YozV|nr:TM2 domain-containing protein [Coriobacteriaceae bacterium]